jgi:hypothetical protein
MAWQLVEEVLAAAPADLGGRDLRVLVAIATEARAEARVCSAGETVLRRKAGNCSPRTLFRALASLERRGLIKRTEAGRRGHRSRIELLPMGDSEVSPYGGVRVSDPGPKGDTRVAGYPAVRVSDPGLKGDMRVAPVPYPSRRDTPYLSRQTSRLDGALAALGFDQAETREIKDFADAKSDVSATGYLWAMIRNGSARDWLADHRGGADPDELGDETEAAGEVWQVIRAALAADPALAHHGDDCARFIARRLDFAIRGPESDEPAPPPRTYLRTFRSEPRGWAKDCGRRHEAEAAP